MFAAEFGPPLLLAARFVRLTIGTFGCCYYCYWFAVFKRFYEDRLFADDLVMDYYLRVSRDLTRVGCDTNLYWDALSTAD